MQCHATCVLTKLPHQRGSCESPPVRAATHLLPLRGAGPRLPLPTATSPCARAKLCARSSQAWRAKLGCVVCMPRWREEAEVHGAR